MTSIEFSNHTHRTWILIAHRSGAKLFLSTRSGNQIRRLQDFDYPQGRLKNHDIDTDDKGRRNSSVAGSNNSGGIHSHSPSNQAKGGLDKHEASVSHFADLFAQQLANFLREGRARNEYEDLILLAEPWFLGKLRSQLDKETTKKVTVSLNHNFADVPEHELKSQLKEIISSHRKVA